MASQFALQAAPFLPESISSVVKKWPPKGLEREALEVLYVNALRIVITLITGKVQGLFWRVTS